MNNIAAAVITFKKVLEPAFSDYAERVLQNGQVLARTLLQHGALLVTDGTDNHLMVLDTVGANWCAGQGLCRRCPVPGSISIGMTHRRVVAIAMRRAPPPAESLPMTDEPSVLFVACCT
jgi:hypothetical protein